MEAFVDRGKDDIFGSHDLEDIILLVDGRPELIDEVQDSPDELKAYVAEIIQRLRDLPQIEDAIEGHLGSLLDAAARIPIVRERLQLLAKN